MPKRTKPLPDLPRIPPPPEYRKPRRTITPPTWHCGLCEHWPPTDDELPPPWQTTAAAPLTWLIPEGAKIDLQDDRALIVSFVVPPEQAAHFVTMAAGKAPAPDQGPRLVVLR